MMITYYAVKHSRTPLKKLASWVLKSLLVMSSCNVSVFLRLFPNSVRVLRTEVDRKSREGKLNDWFDLKSEAGAAAKCWFKYRILRQLTSIWWICFRSNKDVCRYSRNPLTVPTLTHLNAWNVINRVPVVTRLSAKTDGLPYLSSIVYLHYKTTGDVSPFEAFILIFFLFWVRGSLNLSLSLYQSILLEPVSSPLVKDTKP